MQKLSTIPEASTIAVLGPKGSFSYKAGELITAEREDLQIQDFPSMREVRRSIQQGCLALLPRINYSSGVEPDNQSMLFTARVRKRAQALLGVQICVGGNGEPRWNEVTDVFSKDVALRQCRETLNSRCSDALWHETASTVAGIQHVASAGTVQQIAVGSKAAMEQYGLNVWLEGASNAELHGSENVTEFMLLSEESPDESLFEPDLKYHGMVLTPANKPRTIEKISRILGDAGMDQESLSEMPYAPGMFRFLMLFKKIDEGADIPGMLRELEKLPAANGRYPLIKSLGSWSDRVVDPSLQSPQSLL